MFTKGGHKVTKGTYWSLTNGQRVDIAQEGTLPGDSKMVYLKAPVGVVLATAPILGLIFAVFLPFIGIAMALGLVAQKLASGMAEAAAKSVSFGWRPVEAYLAGRKKRKSSRKDEQQEQPK
jgi:hypothetical protein